jgi:hypothetical protein
MYSIVEQLESRGGSLQDSLSLSLSLSLCGLHYGIFVASNVQEIRSKVTAA